MVEEQLNQKNFRDYLKSIKGIRDKRFKSIMEVL